MTYSEREQEMYERGRRAGYAAGWRDGVDAIVKVYTDAGRAVMRQPAPLKPKRQPLRITDLITALMEST